MIMAGADLISTDIEEIKMTRMGNSMSLCKCVIGGFQNLQPDIYIALTSDEMNPTEIDCVITHIDDKQSIDACYMLQTVYDYPYTDYCLVSVWDLGKTTIKQINNLWIGNDE